MEVDPNKGRHLDIQTIFFADDDTDDQLLFAQALHDVAPHVRLEITKDGTELLSLLQNFKPELLFLDLDMPSKNGLECLKEIRSNPSLTDMAVVVFSSTSRPANISVAYEMGANLFFMKPSSYIELVDALRNILSFNWGDPAAVQELKLKKSPLPLKNNTAEKI
ncbi:MAG: response regulator [Chitinophagaceae bacterium]